MICSEACTAAAALDGQPLGDGVLPALSLIAVDHAPLALEQAVDHLWQGVQHMGAENQLDKGVAAANLLHHLLLLASCKPHRPTIMVGFFCFKRRSSPTMLIRRSTSAFSLTAQVLYMDDVRLLLADSRLAAHIQQQPP